MKRICAGQQISWQRKGCNKFIGTVVSFCPKGTPIYHIKAIHKFSIPELHRLDVDRSSVDRYLINVPNIGVVSVVAKTIERQNPDGEKQDWVYSEHAINRSEEFNQELRKIVSGFAIKEFDEFLLSLPRTFN